MTTAEFWGPINTTPGFWVGLDKLPWADDLFALCLLAAGGVRGTTTNDGDGFGELYVVTSPSRCPGCVREKEDWLLRHFGLPPDRMIPTPHKELLAVRTGKVGYSSSVASSTGIKTTEKRWAEPNVLVDDYGRNCRRFETAGGYGVLFPAHHNRRYGDAADPMRLVRPELETLITLG